MLGGNGSNKPVYIELRHTMKKSVSLLTVLACFAFTLSAKTIYLNTGGAELWNQAGAKFAVWHWQGSNAGSWSAWMTAVSGDVYSTTISDNSDKVIFVRFANTVASPAWEGVTIWNKTENLTPGSNDCYTITGWNSGEGMWSTYGTSGGGGSTQPVTPTDYSTAVPSECEDIMLQCFYWNSHYNNGFGDTKWITLYNQAAEIGNYFSLVWLPPSSKPSGISSGLGYIADDYSSQSSNLGLKAYLVNLISALHANGVRVLADVVINHCGNYSNKCDFYTFNFGSYGTFSPTSAWITSDDEGGCNSNGNRDDGQHDANYGAARDWDHKNANVQAMCRAYLKWLKGEMKYDGFRFDYVGGYHVSHIQDYVTASKPYFSVIEYWDGNATTLKTRINETDKNTLAFDFANYYTAFRDGIGAGNYSKLINPGLRGQGYSKYAVLFVDNHDTFNRYASDYQVKDFLNTGDGSSINNASKVLQANAYMLAMPGVPCVFYPHWVRYKSEIQKMITARRAAGIHSESAVNETSGSGYYEATVTGKRGNVILYLGSSATKAAPAGYTKACSGNGYAVYYTGSWTDVDQVTAAPVRGKKIMKGGQLLIQVEDKTYNVLGQPIR